MLNLKKILSVSLPEWLLFTLSSIFIVRIPSFFEPFYYGDELIYLTLGNGIRKGLVLYKDIHDNKTPFLYFIAAMSQNIFWFRVILCLWMIVTTIVFWKLTKKLFSKKIYLQKLSTIAFAVFTSIPILEGQIANAELFLIGFSIAAIYFALNKDIKSSFIAGMMISLGTLFKVPAVFDAGAIFFLFLLQTKFNKEGILLLLKRSFLLVIGILIPIVISFIWYYLRGALSEYVTAAFLQNVGYVASNRLGSIQNTVPILTKLMPIITRGIVVLVGFILLLIFRKKVSISFSVACAWLLTSLFAVTLSERPYPHYLIQAAPAVALLVGMLLTSRIKVQALTIIPLSLAVFVPVYYKFWYYPPLPYFSNFLHLVTTSNRESYIKLFGDNTLINYQIADEVTKTVSKSDKIFVWGDGPPIYSLTRNLPAIKYVANYHIYDYSSITETVDSLSQNPPRLIVIMPGESVPTELYSFIRSKYRILNTIEGATFWYNIPNG